jgi:hypothetical protein
MNEERVGRRHPPMNEERGGRGPPMNEERVGRVRR